MKILVINGPNLNMLGVREPDIYGRATLPDLEALVRAYCREICVRVEFFQSNHEGGIIDRIHAAKGNVDAIIINPGAYTHYSIAIRDAVKAVEIPTVEVHISNIHDREEFRSKSVIAPVCAGQISGFGDNSYLVALKAVELLLKGVY
jgi:3-dehydroquinate dehydratase-2